MALGANMARWQPPPLPLTFTAYPTPTQGKGSKKYIKMTRKDDLTFSCSHLMVELSVLAGWKSNQSPVR